MVLTIRQFFNEHCNGLLLRVSLVHLTVELVI